MSFLCEGSGSERSFVEELIPKKVRFREEDGELNNDMMVDLASEQNISWRDKLVGQLSKEGSNGSESKEDFEILEGDIQKSVVNGVPSINFSDRIFQFLDCGSSLVNTVQPWTLTFDSRQAYPSVVMAWIRFPDLPSYLYNHKIITQIGGMVGKVVKLDMNTDNKARGRFARMAVYVDLEKPLVSQILINGRKQNVEYESLSTIYFQCGRYGHIDISCPFRNTGSIGEKSGDQHEKVTEIQNTTMDRSERKDDNFGPWMIVERKSRRKTRENGQNNFSNNNNGKNNSKTLNNRDFRKGIKEGDLSDHRNTKGKEINTGVISKNGFDSLSNGHIEAGIKNFNNYNGQIEEVGQIGYISPNNKGKDGSKSKPTFNMNKESLPVSSKKTNNIGHDRKDADQAQKAAAKTGLVSVAQQAAAGSGRSNSPIVVAGNLSFTEAMGKLQEDKPGSTLVTPMKVGDGMHVEEVELGRLDSERHSTVVFRDSKDMTNTTPFPISKLDRSPVNISGSRKTFINKGKGISKKRSKILQGQSTRFKINGAQKVSLKESMEQIAESKRCDLFGNFVDSCELQDLGFNGPPFTWQRGETLVRLDRGLVNDAWMATFPQSLVHHLTRIKSDHRPLLLITKPDILTPKGRPFRFLAGWTMHNNFSNFVKGKWEFKGNMTDSLNNFTAFVKDWNRDVYGFLGNRKRKLMRSLNNIQRALELSTSTHLVKKEREIRDELENVLDHEDFLWRQKARCDWLQLGDRNTNFFHSRTIKRRKCNRIMSLRVDNGDWCSDQTILQNKAVEFFEKLYGEVPTVLRDTPNNGFPCLNPSEITFLEATILNEEIKRTLFDMAPLKAPGSDGYHTLFFQSKWDILGNDVCQWVKNVFDGRPIEPELNNTLIVLIPKKDNPENFSQFRPISLCSVLYKLVMKVISNRFKVIFPKLISQEQAGFIVGRNIFDNIILAQEVIHSMRCNRKGRKWMAVKLDLEKAYDRVSWDFINVSLTAAGIPIFLRNVIMSAISSFTMQILWNRVPTQKFKPNRGIRQGCPLSPYLFVLCMEWLGHFIHSGIEVGTWDPIRLSRSGPPISHLFFADDLVIFCKAQIEQARLLESILSLFCEISGHKISVRKSNIFFSKNTEADNRVPLLHDRVTKNTLNFVVEKIRRKLNSWDARKLSFARRVTLAQSVLLSIPSYFMQTMMIPKGVCDDIERLKPMFTSMEMPIQTLASYSREFNLVYRRWGQHSLLERSLDSREMVNIDGSWNLDLFHVWVPEEVINRITSIPPPHPDSGEDIVIWARSATGTFSVRSAYWSLKEDTWNPHEEYWKIPWKYKGPQRVRMFLWLAFRERLLTNSERARRGISHSSSCIICGHGFEDLEHVLRDCPAAKEVWMLVLPNQLKQRFFSVSFQDWFILNLCFHESLQGSGLTWSCLFGLIVWRIWKNRNLFIFQHISWSATEVVKVSSCWARQYESIQDVHKSTDQNFNIPNSSEGKWVYLSTDGAVSSNTGVAATGGVARDYEGNWILGFNHFLGNYSPIEAEIWGIMDGILILLNKGYRRIIIISDNLEVVQNLSALNTGESEIAILRRTKRIIQSEGEWKIKHVPRNMNMVADRLAKLSLSWKTSLQIITEAPKEILDSLQADKANGYFL
ncbi:LINE-1 reverse transcriptase isogeny [Gossypium australe]|uniref:LINE-1 reverse transcriptase isogeny n=1 Tax=Gossypium australe TaxID=47621 RepID=A0A5B6WZE9_9ROSI|nr:LINE-1 reverse transcriptase isogeny [Gossypium australe]